MIEFLQYLDGPAWCIIAGGSVAIVASTIVAIKEKESRALRVCSFVAAIGGVLTIVGGIWAGYQNESSDATAARQDIIRMDERLAPYLEDYQECIGYMDMDEDGFDLDDIGNILFSILNPDHAYFNRLNVFDLYFESLDRVHATTEQSLLKMDRSRYPELADVLEQHLRGIDSLDPVTVHQGIARDSRDTTLIRRDGKIRRIIARQLQLEHLDTMTETPAAILTPYLRLYRFIEESIAFRSKYDSLLARIRSGGD